MNKKEKQLLFIHAGSCISFLKNEFVSCRVFPNQMYLIEDVLYFPNGEVAVEGVKNVQDVEYFLKVTTEDVQIIYGLEAKEHIRSKFDIEVYDCLYVVSDENGEKQLFSIFGELIAKNFLNFDVFGFSWINAPFSNYIPQWYAISVVDSNGSTIWQLFKNDCLVATSKNSFRVNAEHSRYATTDDDGKFLIFANNSKLLHKGLDKYAEIDNILITRVGDVYEIFTIDDENFNDKSIWKGCEQKLLSEIYIIDKDDVGDACIDDIIKN